LKVSDGRLYLISKVFRSSRNRPSHAKSMIQLLLFSNLTKSSKVDSQYSNLLSIRCNTSTNCVAATQCNTADIITTHNPNMHKILSLTAKKIIIQVINIIKPRTRL